LSGFQFEGRIDYSVRDPEKIAEHSRRWEGAGATHLSVITMHAGLKTVDEHIGALRELAEVLL
ncbi:MAG TPA: hypothetical protein VIX84_11425, partial [Acidimicrobiales bacterium]